MKLKFRKTSFAAALLLIMVMSLVAPTVTFAASSPEFTALQKFDFDKTVSAADSSLANKLTQQFRDFTTLKEQNRSWEQKVGALHYQNDDRVAALRKRISQIDAAKLNNLKIQVEQTKKRYQPMFDLYTSVNRQLAVARKLKNKTFTAVLSTQAEGLKFTTQLAHADIKVKDAALSSARKTASDAMKRVRDTLLTIDPIKVQIKAAKAALSSPKNSRDSVWKTFTQAVKKREAKSASDTFGSLNALSGQLAEQQQKMYAMESRIADIIQRAETQIPR
ncbi:MAG: hypothetical protein JWR03_1650 [Cohnella sp.]|nr:hypothetical protein [Cohnella sp.]